MKPIYREREKKKARLRYRRYHRLLLLYYSNLSGQVASRSAVMWYKYAERLLIHTLSQETVDSIITVSNADESLVAHISCVQIRRG